MRPVAFGRSQQPKTGSNQQPKNSGTKKDQYGHSDRPFNALQFLRFNRKIGDFAAQRYAVDGRKLTEEEWTAYAPTVLPSQADEVTLKECFKDPNWIAPKGNLA